MEMVDGLETAKEKVKYILEKFPETRDSDKKLWLRFLEVFFNMRLKIGSEAFVAFECVLMDSEVPTMESVRRVRQKFQEGGQFVGKKREERLEMADRVFNWAVGDQGELFDE